MSVCSWVCTATPCRGRAARLGEGTNGFQSLLNKVVYSYIFYWRCTEKKPVSVQKNCSALEFLTLAI